MSRPHEKKRHLEDYYEIQAKPFSKTKLLSILGVTPRPAQYLDRGHYNVEGVSEGV